jgi:hypothetical protein
MTAPPPKQVLVELPFTPYPHQRAAHELRRRARFVVLVWHRRAGKTVWAIVELVLSALRTSRQRARYAYVAPLLKQAKAVAWDYLKHFARCIPGTAINESELAVTFPHGAQVRLYGADNPDALRGIYLDGAVLDEVADMKPEVWGEILRPALADRQGWSVFIGTPKGINLFSELYYRAERGEDGWASDLKRASDTGVLPAEEIEAARQEMSPAQFAQEFEVDFHAAVEDTLIRLDAVLEAQRRHVAKESYDFAPRVLGVDVARYGGDRSCIFPRQGLCAFQPRVLRGADTMQVAAQVAEMNERWKPDAIFVDAGGLGAGVVDRLRQLRVDVVPVDFGGRPTEARFENKRAEMWWALAEWLKSGGCLPDLQELQKDLCAPRYTFSNARGKVQLESKEAMRERGLPSPDVGDALALTFAFPVTPRHQRAATPVNRGEYDPFEEG